MSSLIHSTPITVNFSSGSLAGTPSTHGNHDPDSANVLRILHNFDTKGQTALVSPCCQDTLANLIGIDVCNDLITVTVGKLNREGLKGVTLGHKVLDSMLEVCCGKVTSPNPLELIIG